MRRAHDRTGVVDGERCPQSELLLRKMQCITDCRKDEQRDRVQDENGQVNDVQYGIYKDARGYLKVNAPNVAGKEKKRR